MCLGTAVKKKTTFWEFRLQAAPRFVYMPVEQLKTIRGYAIFHNRFRRRLPLIRFFVAFKEFSAVFGEGLDFQKQPKFPLHLYRVDHFPALTGRLRLLGSLEALTA